MSSTLEAACLQIVFDNEKKIIYLLFILKDDEEEEDACNRFKTGTRRKRHFYRQQLPPQLRDNPVNFGYLYQVHRRTEKLKRGARLRGGAEY